MNDGWWTAWLAAWSALAGSGITVMIQQARKWSRGERETMANDEASEAVVSAAKRLGELAAPQAELLDKISADIRWTENYVRGLGIKFEVWVPAGVNSRIEIGWGLGEPDAWRMLCRMMGNKSQRRILIETPSWTRLEVGHAIPSLLEAIARCMTELRTPEPR